MGLLNDVYDTADHLARQKEAKKKRDKAKTAGQKNM